jgi:hypothetical protein
MEDTEKLCAKCGSLVEIGSIFCRKCGAALQPPTALIHSIADDAKTRPTSRTNRIVLNVVKGIAAAAAVIFIFCPLGTGAQVLGFVGSLVVLLICHLVITKIDASYEDKNAGYWPSRPMDWGPRPDGHGATKNEK